MKRISEEVSFHGKAEKITVMDFRKCPGEVLQKAELGLTIIITKGGKEICYLTPFAMPKTKPSIASLEAILAKEDDSNLRILPNGQVVEFLNSDIKSYCKEDSCKGEH